MLILWKEVKGFEGLYEVSELGVVRGIGNRKKNFSDRTIKFCLDRDGYKRIGVFDKNRKRKTVGIHRLVAIAFIPNPENKPCVNHINGLKWDNRVENLEWATVQENNKHAYDTGLNKGTIGEINGQSKLTEEQVLKILNTEGTHTSIAKDYNITRTAITRIKNGTRWNHVYKKWKEQSE